MILRYSGFLPTITNGTLNNNPHQDLGDNLVVINTRKMVIPEKKVYWWYSGYASGHRHVYAKDFHLFRPTECLRLQVEFKLDKIFPHFVKDRMSRLYLYPDEDYPYAANISKVIEGPNNVYRSLSDYTENDIANFVEAPDCRFREPRPLYEWDDLD
eukprot:sb/3473185/